MFFNAQPFPANESGEAAFYWCTGEQTSRSFCPARWRAMQEWIKTTTEVSDIVRIIRNVSKETDALPW